MRRITAALALLLLASPAMAQLQGGTVSGVVLDQTQAVLPGATAELRGADVTRTVTTDGVGQFRFLDVAPGTYRLHVALQGFRGPDRENILVEVGKSVDLKMELRVDNLSDFVNVVAPTPMIDRRQTGTATNVTASETQYITTSLDPFAPIR